MNRTYQLRKEYGTWLNSYNWDYFITLTSYSWITLKQATNYINTFGNKLNQRNERMSMVWFAEPHLSGSYHIHALIHFSTKQDYTIVLKQKWNEVVKRRSEVHIEKYSKDKGACYYIVKNVIHSHLNSNWSFYNDEYLSLHNDTPLELLPILNQHY